MSFFPFEKIRSGQKEFMDDVKKTIDSGSILLADASTGIGKTAAVLAPTLEYAVENNKVIFFLTPRHSQHAIVVETIKKINEQPENIRQIIVADIIGKNGCAIRKQLMFCHRRIFLNIAGELKSKANAHFTAILFTIRNIQRLPMPV